jgi:hypothetical protein
MDMKNISKMWMDSLKMFDNMYVSSIIIFVLFLLVSALFTNINHEIKQLLNNQIVRIIVVLAIIWVAPKNVTIAILLATLYCMSMHSISLKGLMEGFKDRVGKDDEDEDKGIKKDRTERDVVKKDAKATKAKSMKDDSENTETFENEGDENKEDDNETETFQNQIQEDFLPFLSNSQYESNFSSPLEQAPSGCLSTDPNQFALVGEPCSAVATFNGELNAQGMEPIMGFNMNQSQSQTAQPL